MLAGKHDIPPPEVLAYFEAADGPEVLVLEEIKLDGTLANTEPAAQLLGPVLRDAPHRDTPEGLAVEQIQGAARRAAVGARLFQYCLEDRLELTRRGIDDLQYIGRRGLLLQQLAQFAYSRSQ